MLVILRSADQRLGSTLQRNIAAVASRWRYCVRFEARISRTGSDVLTNRTNRWLK